MPTPITTTRPPAASRPRAAAADRVLARPVAPAGGAAGGVAPIARAVAKALHGAGTVPAALTATTGRIEAIWRNDGGKHDACISKVCELIRAARHEVCVQAYIIDVDSTAFQELAAAIADKQREIPGFKVYFVTTMVPNAKVSLWERCRNLRLSKELDRRGIRAEVADFVNPIVTRQSNHSKSFLIDGHTAVVGGDNIDDQCEKDTMLKLTGPVLDGLLADFDHAWMAAYARKRGLESGPYQAPRHRRDEAPPSAAPLVPLTLLTKAGRGLPGAFYANDADRGLLAAMDAARAEIKIASPNFNDMAAMEAVAAAAARGVKVKIMLPKGYLELPSAIDRASNSAFARWVAQLPPAVADRIELRWCARPTGELLDNHTKYVSVDGEWAYAGSQNMDNQSWRYSRELGVGIADPRAVKRLDAASFDGDWVHARPVARTPGDMMRPAIGPWRLMLEAVARWLFE